MGIYRILGFVLLVVGAMLLVFGYNSSQSVGERVVEGVTGRFTNQTMWYLVGGAAVAVAGAGMVFLGKRSTT